MEILVRRATRIAVAVALAFAALGGVPRAAGAQDEQLLASGPGVITAPQQESQDSATGRVVIGFDPDLEPQVLRIVERLGGTVERTSDGFAAAVLEPPLGDGAQEFAEQVAQLPGVEYAEPEHGFTIAGAPNDTYYAEQWGLARIGLPAARDVSTGRQTVKVAVIDTGLNFAHLDGPVHVDTVNDWDFVDGDNEANDQNGHGTHVTGIIAAATDNAFGVAGVAPGVTVLPVRVLDAGGNGNVLAVVDGIKWAADHGAKVINMSLTTDESMTVLLEACEYAQQRGCLIVAATGNKGADARFAGRVAYPAAYPGVVAVGATAQGDGRAKFSQYGPELDLMAPGEAIWSLGLTSNMLAKLSGTSMATPHVAGVAALVQSVVPTWTADMVTECLIMTAEDLGANGFDSQSGAGLVRADGGVQMALTASDDEIPGVPLPGASFTGELDAKHDPHDVFSIRSKEGGVFRVRIRSAQGSFTLRLFGPGQQSMGAGHAVANAAPEVGVNTLTYTVPLGSGGRHYLDVYAPSGSGEYFVDLESGQPTAVSLKAPTTVAYKGSGTLTGRLLAANVGAVEGRAVSVLAKPAGATAWSEVGTAVTDQYGNWSKSVKPSRRTQYVVAFSGEHKLLLSAASTIKTISPKAYLTAPTAPKTAYKNRYFTTTGYLKPRPGSASVKIKAYKYDTAKKKYVLKKTYTAKLKKYNSTTTKYSAKVRFTSRGKWKLVAYTPASVQNAATTSAGRYRTVRY